MTSSAASDSVWGQSNQIGTGCGDVPAGADTALALLVHDALAEPGLVLLETVDQLGQRSRELRLVLQRVQHSELGALRRPPGHLPPHGLQFQACHRRILIQDLRDHVVHGAHAFVHHPFHLGVAWPATPTRFTY
ncbi:hypothetical protein [Actinomadura sp. NPDC000600]|uniref:hypothetical protein n=1 Tax=Actinomadura sp. NPDC000600 TaxID=3154262 RepID=UPI00339B6491